MGDDARSNHLKFFTLKNGSRPLTAYTGLAQTASFYVRALDGQLAIVYRILDGARGGNAGIQIVDRLDRAGIDA